MSIQIGIELEFLVAHSAEGVEPSRKDRKDTRWPEGDVKPEPVNLPDSKSYAKAHRSCIYQICTTLRDEGFPVACLAGYDLNDVAAETAAYGGTIEAFNSVPYRVWNAERINPFMPRSTYSFWVVTPEVHITQHIQAKKYWRRPSAVRGYEWYGLEISTPILSELSEFENQLPTVKKMVESLTSTTKIWINKHCGFHLHASPSHAPLGLMYAKRVTALTYVLEHSFIYEVSHPCRRSSRHCKPISRMSRIALGHYGKQAEDSDFRAVVTALSAARAISRDEMIANEAAMFRALGKIMGCADMQALSEGLGISDAPAAEEFNPTRAQRGAIALSKFGTVEFRYPQSSFDIDYIIFWTRLLRRIFAIASLDIDRFAQKLVELYQLAIAKPPKSQVEWLEALDLVSSLHIVRTKVTEYRTAHQKLNKTGILPNKE